MSSGFDQRWAGGEGAGGSRLVLGLALAAGALFAAPVTAQAATLVNRGGTLTYTAAEGSFNGVYFNEGPPATVRVVEHAAADYSGVACAGNPDAAACYDPITSDGTCTENRAGGDYTCAGVTKVVADAGDLDDRFDARGLTEARATLHGGDGRDGLQGGQGNDVLAGGAGDDSLSGGYGDDALDAGAGDDSLTGDLGNDTEIGGAGDDSLYSFGRADVPEGADLVSGGSGVDSFTYGFGLDWIGVPAPAVSITLNGAADDGIAGEHDNVDVEDVSASSAVVRRPDPPDLYGPPALGTVTLVGDDQPNVLRAEGRSSRITGGAGNDVLQGTGGDDVIDSREGFADRVQCADGDDTVIADDLDSISETCERPQIAARDAGPPAIAFTAPGAGAPTPRTTVGRVAPTAVSLSVKPRTDRSAPFRFRISGRVKLPATVSPAAGCATGVVRIRAKAGRTTIATRRAKLKPNCTFTKRMTLRRIPRDGRLRVTARFQGNDVLRARSAHSKTVRTRGSPGLA